MLSDFFASVFTCKSSNYTTKVAEVKGKNQEKKELPAVSEDQAQVHLKNLKEHKSMGPNKIHLQLLWKLAAEVAKSPFIVFKRSCQFGEFRTDWKRET